MNELPLNLQLRELLGDDGLLVNGRRRRLVFSETGPDGGITKIMPLTVAELSGAGELGVLYTLADGPDAGAKLTWAVPSGASTPTWCWWLWPQAAYEF